jgi:hypothetical protein
LKIEILCPWHDSKLVMWGKANETIQNCRGKTSWHLCCLPSRN